MVLDLWGDLTGEIHEVVSDQPHDVKAVGDDFGIWEVAFDEASIRAAKVDADDPDLVPSEQAFHEALERLVAFTFDDIKDLVVFDVAEGRGEALFLVKGMFVNPKDLRALERDSLCGFAFIKVLVEALNVGRADVYPFGQSACGNAVMVEPGCFPSEGFAGLLAGQDPWQRRIEGFAALGASIPAMLDFQPTALTQHIEMPKGPDALSMHPRG